MARNSAFAACSSTPYTCFDDLLVALQLHASLTSSFSFYSAQLNEKMADQLTDIVTDAVLYIRKPDEPLDLHMVSCWESCALHWLVKHIQR